MNTKQLSQLAVLMALCCTANASNESPNESDELRIGDSRMNPAFITPYTSRFELTRIDADGHREPNGEWTDRVEFVEREGVRLMRREVSRTTAAGIEDMWRVHLVDANSLAPIVTDQRGDAGSVSHIDFSGKELVATILPSSESASIRVPLEFDESPFDLSIWATLLMSVPFETGASVKIPVLGTGGVLQWETITIDGEEEIELPLGERVTTYRVSTKERPWTAWLSKQRSPYIFKTLQRFADGSTWESVLIESGGL